MGIVAKKILSNVTFGPGILAWVNFDCTRNAAGVTDASNTARFIRGSGNVEQVLKTGTGVYQIDFIRSLPKVDPADPISENGYARFVDSTAHHAFIDQDSFPLFASNTTVEFRTSLNVVTNPDYGFFMAVGNSQGKKYPIKAWGQFAGAASNGSAVTYGSGFTNSIQRISSGLYECTFDYALPPALSGYAIFANSYSYVSRIDTTTPPAADKFRVEFFDGAEVLRNQDYNCVVAVAPEGTQSDPTLPSGEIKAWVAFDGNSTENANCLYSGETLGYNVSSVVRTSVKGVYAINFIKPLGPAVQTNIAPHAILVNGYGDLEDTVITGGGDVYATQLVQGEVTSVPSLSVQFWSTQASPTRRDPDVGYVCVIQ